MRRRLDVINTFFLMSLGVATALASTLSDPITTIGMRFSADTGFVLLFLGALNLARLQNHDGRIRRISLWANLIACIWLIIQVVTLPGWPLILGVVSTATAVMLSLRS